MVNTINQAFTEVYDIVMHFEPELIRKIPKNFIDMMKKNMDVRI